MICFPENPKEAGERWFLRSEPYNANKKFIVVIALNPSSASALNPREPNQKLDPTTRRILQRFERDGESERPIVLINLFPIRGSKKELKSKDQDELLQQIRESVPVTLELLKTIIDSAERVVLAWGDPEDPNHKKRKQIVLPALISILNELLEDKPDIVVRAVAGGKKRHYPAHPLSRPPKGVDWLHTDWVDGRKLLLRQALEHK